MATGTAAVEAPPFYPLRSAWGTQAEASSLTDSLRGSRDRLTIRPASDAGWQLAALRPLSELRTQADTEKGSPWPQPLVSHYARYFRDGNRTAYEALVAGRQERLTRAVVMAAMSESAESGPDSGDAWLDEVIDGAYLLCEQSSWSWAAHDDVFTRNGEVVPDRTRPYLDLGAGEVVAQLAWLDLVLGDALDDRAPGLRKRIRLETNERVIRPFLDRLDWHWLGLNGDVHNWNPWIHSNIIAAALLLVDDPDEQAQVIARCIEGLDRFLASIPADGAIDEGFAYWWNGAGRALEGLALLEEATGGELNADLPVIRALVAFPHRMHLGHRWFLNVADGPARAHEGLPWGMLHRWAVRLGDSEAAAHAAAFTAVEPEPNAAAGLGRVLTQLASRTQRTQPGDSKRRNEGPLGRLLSPGWGTYLPSVQIMVARQNPGSTDGLTLAAKGGHNGEHHNHRDVGSVVVAVDGVPLLVDAGQPTYTAQTFGPDRYQIRAMQSAWHSVPAPFGLEQGTGSSFAATVIQEPTPEEPTLALGLGTAYGLDHAEQWIRTSLMNRELGSVVIDDRWNLPAPPPEGTPDVDITYLVAGTVHVGTDATATVTPEGIPAAETTRGLHLRWKPATAVVLVDEWHLDDPLLRDVWGDKLTRLRFRMPAENRASGAFTLTVEATP
ncbi:heparinase II/III-family protein [Paenarthrobacter aurescens]|uniref:heparinase II/III-family protein n=1 Tax=Paenarthrobacter aurescens TaxID=43663 RepID=UPI0021C00B94|nr:heparinase II/III-family protein [Paenarthrobacter aurescens]MCT9870776.1 heparinase II/III-family protein [Paenarthrobacter aurescens]